MARHVVDPTSMHRYTDETERVARAALGYARDRLRLHPVPLDGPRTAEELTEARRRHDHRGRAGRRGGDAALRRGARPGHHLDRQPAVPGVHPGGADGALDDVRPRRRGVVDLRRDMDGGLGRGLRREPGARLARRSGRPPGDGSGLLRSGGTIGNLSALVAARHTHRAANGGGAAHRFGSRAPTRRTRRSPRRPR